MVTQKPRPKWQVYRLKPDGTIIEMHEWYRPDWAQQCAEELAFKFRRTKADVILVDAEGGQSKVEMRMRWSRIDQVQAETA